MTDVGQCFLGFACTVLLSVLTGDQSLLLQTHTLIHNFISPPYRENVRLHEHELRRFYNPFTSNGKQAQLLVMTHFTAAVDTTTDFVGFETVQLKSVEVTDSFSLM